MLTSFVRQNFATKYLSVRVSLPKTILNYPTFLRWLKTVSGVIQDVDFDGSLLPLFINWSYNHGVKNCPITGEYGRIIFVTQ